MEESRKKAKKYTAHLDECQKEQATSKQNETDNKDNTDVLLEDTKILPDESLYSIVARKKSTNTSLKKPSITKEEKTDNNVQDEKNNLKKRKIINKDANTFKKRNDNAVRNNNTKNTKKKEIDPQHAQDYFLVMRHETYELIKLLAAEDMNRWNSR